MLRRGIARRVNTLTVFQRRYVQHSSMLDVRYQTLPFGHARRWPPTRNAPGSATSASGGARAIRRGPVMADRVSSPNRSQ